MIVSILALVRVILTDDINMAFPWNLTYILALKLANYNVPKDLIREVILLKSWTQR